MVIVKLISGLGNQLFQYALARQLALKNNVPLMLDTSFFDSQHLRSYKLNHYHIAATIANPNQINKMHGGRAKKIISPRLYYRLERLFLKYNRYYKEPKWWDYNPDLLYHTPANIYLDGYWQCYKYFEDINPAIFNELSLKDTTEHDSYPFLNAVMQQDSSVSIHIRRGDYITDTVANNLMGVLPLSYYHQAIKYMSEQVIAPNFYIFSDDLNWAADHLKIVAPVTFVDMAGGSKDYLELDLMSRCTHNIIANSSFSWWGAFLNQHPGKIVIGPQNWVKQPEINKEINLLFPQWIKM
jgi:hypothetical protein